MFLVTQLLKKQWVMVPNQYSEYPIVGICVSNYPIRKKSYLQLWTEFNFRQKLMVEICFHFH